MLFVATSYAKSKSKVDCHCWPNVTVQSTSYIAQFISLPLTNIKSHMSFPIHIQMDRK